jgi:hypothetical protein
MMIKTDANAAARFWWMLRQLVMKSSSFKWRITASRKYGVSTNDKTETPKIVPNYTFDNGNYQLQQLPKWKTILKTKIIWLLMFEKQSVSRRVCEL